MSINPPSRTIRVSAGAAEYVTGRIEETNGDDLASATFEVGLGTHDVPPAVWSNPAETEIDGPVALVSMLVDNSVAPVARGWLWVRITDVPETLLRRCDGGYVTLV